MIQVEYIFTIPGEQDLNRMLDSFKYLSYSEMIEYISYILDKESIAEEETNIAYIKDLNHCTFNGYTVNMRLVSRDNLVITDTKTVNTWAFEYADNVKIRLSLSHIDEGNILELKSYSTGGHPIGLCIGILNKLQEV